MRPDGIRCLLALRLTEDADEKYRRDKRRREGMARRARTTPA
jgi:hypothetical protein